MRWIGSKALALGAALAVAVGTIATSPGPAHAAGNAHGALARTMRVRDALRALGPRADAVAKRHGSSAAKWKAVAADDAAWVDPDGAMFYLDPPAEGGQVTAPVAPASAPFAYTQTFLLHSNPTSTRKLYLDFTGHTISGTAWGGGAALTADPYTIDADLTTFSAAEQDQIQDVWQRVAEDYQPFDIDVTTEDPGYAGINRASTTDNAFGTRVVITGSTSVYNTVCTSGCGGVAYVGTIDSTGANHDFYQPAWVFTNGVGTGGKYIAEAAAHEAGHNMGLRHDGTSTAGYYSGSGAWAPIMGVGYYQPVSQWSLGEYPDANNHEDDYAVAASNSIPSRADDFGGVSNPSPAGLSPVSLTGVIGSRTDQDAFQFTASSGTVSFSAVPSAVGANLDIRLTLLDAAGAVVATNDPPSAYVDGKTASGLNASLSANVAAGVYRVMVDGVGFGDPAVAGGYSDYGSVGAYTLTGTFPAAGVNQSPTAVITATASNQTGYAPLAITYSSAGSSDVDGTIASSSWLFSDGSTATGATVTRTYTAGGTYSATLTVTDNQGATGTATVSTTLSPPLPELVNGVAMTNLGDALNADRYYVVNVPAGAAALVVQSGGGTGDMDLYMRYGALPTTSTYDCSPYTGGNNETCTVTNPAAGAYYVMTHAYAAYSGMSLVGSYTFPFAVTLPSGTTAVLPGGSADLTVTTTGQPGSAAPITLAVSGLPAGMTGSITPSTVTAGGSATLHLAVPVGASATPVTTFTVTGVSGPVTSTATASAQIQAAGNQPPVAVATVSAPTVVTGAPVTFSAAGSTDADGTITSFAWSFSDGTTGSGASVVKTFGAADTYTGTVTVTDDGGATATATATVTVTAPPSFTVAVAPSSATVVPGSSAAYAVTTTAVNGSTLSIALTVGGLPSGVTGSFTPSTVVAGGASTLTLTAAYGTPVTAPTTFTVTGTSGSVIGTSTATVAVAAPPVTALTSGVAATGLSGTLGSMAYYSITVPPNADSLVVTTSGGTGNANLYVQSGSIPTLTTYACRSIGSGNTESCTLTNPTAGTYYVMAHAAAAYSSMSLTARVTVTPVLVSGVPVSGLSATNSGQFFYKIVVPAGKTSLRVTTSGGTGNADLYVRNGSRPTTSAYTCRGFTNSNNETCTINSPAAGTWYILVNARSAFSGLTLTATVS